MAKLLRCRDLGFDCDAEVHAEDEDELLRIVAQHAREVHGVEEVDDAMVDKVLASIRTT
jgi:predicted small metal-binding protein